MNHSVKREVGESPVQFISRVCAMKELNGFTWDDVRDICNTECDLHCSESYYRKGFSQGRFSSCDTSDNYSKYVNAKSYSIADNANNITTDLDDDGILESDEYQELLMMQRVRAEEEKFKLRKERAAFNRLCTEKFKIDIYKELADHVIEKLSEEKPLAEYLPEIRVSDNHKDAILVISDWHYGIDTKNFANKFNTEICRERVAKLTAETVEFCRLNNLHHLNVVNLGDMIAGRIHPTLRIESTEGVVQQTIHTSKIIIEMLEIFTKNKIKVDYYWCLDNHSRIEPDKEKSLKDENLVYFAVELIKGAFAENKNVIIHDNEFGDDIISFNCLGYEIGGCHGDLDKQKKAISNLTLFTGKQYDMILSAHMHHFSADEGDKTLLLCNGTLMGTDSYSADLRLSSTPSQNLILVTDDCVMKDLRRVTL